MPFIVSFPGALASRYTRGTKRTKRTMCIYDYTPYFGCQENQQHFYLQWMKCNKAAERNDKYCPLDKSVPTEELRKLSGNVLSCPVHRHIAVQQHQFKFTQGEDGLVAEFVVNFTEKRVAVVEGASQGLSSGTPSRPATISPDTSTKGQPDRAKQNAAVDNVEPYIDFGEELRREAREKKAKEAVRLSSQRASPSGVEEDPIARPKNPSVKTFERYEQEDKAKEISRGVSHRRGASEDLRRREDELESSEEHRPRSYQGASKRRPREYDDEPLPSPRKTPTSPRSPQSATFDTELIGDNPVGLPARPNVYRRSTDRGQIEEDDANKPATRPKRPSSLRNTTHSDSTEDLVPETPSPYRVSHRTSTGSGSLRKIDEWSDNNPKERGQRPNSSDRKRERSTSADRKPSRAPSSNRGRERDILDRLRDERPDPSSNIAVSRHRRHASSTDITTTTPKSQPHRSRSRSADPQPQLSRTQSTDRDRHRSSSQTSISRRPSEPQNSLSRRPSTSKEPPFTSQPPSRPPSRTSRSRDPSPSTLPNNRPLPTVPSQTTWSAELTRRNSDAKTYVHTVAPSRKWVSPPPSASPVSPVNPVTPSPSSLTSGGGHTVRWNLPGHASESGVGLLSPGSTDSPTLGNVNVNVKRQGQVYRGAGERGGAKRESHDSGYGSYQTAGGHRRGMSSESSPSSTTEYGSLMTPMVSSFGIPGVKKGAQNSLDTNVSQSSLGETKGDEEGSGGGAGVLAGQKKLVKVKGQETAGLPSPPYATKLNVPRPLPDAAYLPLPGEERGGGLLSKKSLGKLKRTFSGFLDKEKGKKVSVV
ncbi:hypothetical protein B0T14DRAFT_596030 [Immersiella caudata]|uniref:Uncharacterized protein n=1 Tax=Immersiella caudata TaxID=314043 RepID=A0AA39U010_9PEZI|nr:hypothetical protein B0T14DRAFT_596030 [Immersiella caudata]